MLAKPGFGALLLWGHRNVDLARLGLQFRDPQEHASHIGEKKTSPALSGTRDANNVEDGVTTNTTTTTHTTV
jgi:hypothetical protein